MGLDPEAVERIRLVGGDELVTELLATFRKATPERLAALREALAAGDPAAAARALHSLRSAAGAVGALQLAETAGRLERAARGGDAAAIERALPELESAVEAVHRAARRLGGDAR